MQIDGEAAQVEIFSDDTMAEHYSNECMIVGKLPASCSHITQPCDVGNCFLAAKTLARRGKIQNVEITHDVRAQLESIIRAHGGSLKGRIAHFGVEWNISLFSCPTESCHN